MAYKPDVYVKAKALLDERRQKAEKAQLLRKAEVYAACPEIRELEKEMASFGAQVIKLVARKQDQDGEIEKLRKSSLEIQRRRKEALVSAGFSADYLDVKYTCPNCGDKGIKDGYYCNCYKELILQCARREIAPLSLLEKSGFSAFNLEEYSDEIVPEFGVSPRSHMSDVLSFCKEYASAFSPHSEGIFMFGKTGLGKTHLSLAIADEVTKRGFNVCYTPTQNAMNRLEKEHFGKADSQSDFFEELRLADLLILDDLGTEFSTSFTVAQLYNIVNTRIIEERPTIISTNLSLEEIESKYSQRFSSRLIGSFKPILFIGDDIRQPK